VTTNSTIERYRLLPWGVQIFGLVLSWTLTILGLIIAMARFRDILTLLSLLPVLGSVGCIAVGVPTGKVTVSGPNYSDEALAFLELPGTTRGEAISSLGPPTLEFHDSRVLAYVCQSGTKWLGAVMVSDPFITHKTTGAAGQAVAEDAQRVLFVAYDQNGLVYAHKVSRLGKHSLRKECIKWERSLRQKPSKE